MPLTVPEIARVYDATAAQFGSEARWEIIRNRQRAGVLLLANMVDLVHTSEALGDQAPWEIAAASMDAAHRLGLSNEPWLTPDLEPGEAVDVDALTTAELTWLGLAEALLEAAAQLDHTTEAAAR